MNPTITLSSDRSSLAQPTPWEAPIFRGYGQPMGALEPVAGRVPSTIRRPRRPVEGRRVLRRLKGFVVEINSTDARVALIHEGQSVLYDAPAAKLREKGVTALNQPFEMDEVSLDVEGFASVVAYEFRPLAKPSDGYAEPLNLDAERKRKLDLIFEKFRPSSG